MNLTSELDRIASVDLFKRDPKTGDLAAGHFLGRPFALGYDQARLLVADARKRKVSGVPQGAFLLAYYENEDAVLEALLLRVLGPASLPTDNDVIASMVEYYKDTLGTSGPTEKLDSFTRYEFSFSGVECRVLGTFYRDADGETCFGADVENFYSAHHYRVVKPTARALEKVVNFREGDVEGQRSDVKIGRVRYASSRRFGARAEEVPVYVSPADFLGKRTALFGMTRTGKSNTVKKVIQATATMSEQAPDRLSPSMPPRGDGAPDIFDPSGQLDPFTPDGLPKYPVGQIVFDINGEYANANLQDDGTAIFDLYRKQTTRYSVIEKPGFKVMKVNFYEDLASGFELVRSHLDADTADYISSFASVDLTPPEDVQDFSAKTRYDRKRAAYLAVLHRAGFPAPASLSVSFQGENSINEAAWPDGAKDPTRGLSLDEAAHWFETVWSQYDELDVFQKAKRKGKEWASEDLKALLIMLTRKSKPSANASISGYRKLRDLVGLHTASVDKPFQEAIAQELREGKIVLVDLSQGDPEIQRLYAERICRHLFADAMSRFIANQPANFLQFYFEEAHNLFPKKDDKDLAQVYNRIAKEGAKLSLGLIYATQEVSSISSNILKNTQNWFIAHLNNEDETRELRKYYDFADFTDGLIRFSAASDKGFVRMKAYSNPFVVPVQVDRFEAKAPAGSSNGTA